MNAFEAGDIEPAVGSPSPGAWWAHQRASKEPATNFERGMAAPAGCKAPYEGHRKQAVMYQLLLKDQAAHRAPVTGLSQLTLQQHQAGRRK